MAVSKLIPNFPCYSLWSHSHVIYGLMSILSRSLMRAIFKSVVSLFCPLIIFFLVLDRGRPQYDRAFRTTVVYHRYLFRPI